MVDLVNFNKLKEEEFNKFKKRIIIILYGSYYPKSEQRYLYSLKKFLINSGYAKTSLVKDYEKYAKDLDTSELSHYCLKISDVNFFIIRKHGKNQGVIRELAYLVDDPDLIAKQAFTVIFEMNSKIPPITQLILDDIERLKIDTKTYTTTSKLKKDLLDKSFFYMCKLKPKLKLVGN